MVASTGIESLKRCCNAVTAVYLEDALRQPNVDDINRLLDEDNAAGFPGCIGSIDCIILLVMVEETRRFQITFIGSSRQWNIRVVVMIIARGQLAM